MSSTFIAAFGNKERLFQSAIDRYLAGPGAYMGPILQEEPTARGAFERLFQAAARRIELDPVNRQAAWLIAGQC